MKPQKVLLSGTEIKKLHTLKPCYNEPQYSEFRDIVNKTKHITFDIVNYSI